MLRALFVSLLVLVSWQSAASNALPDFASIKDVKQKKAAFFEYLKPHIDKANAEIRDERRFILATDFQKMNMAQQQRLEQLLKKYKVSTEGFSMNTKKALLKKVDIVPPSLALAQAANESAWGTSRFARKGLNFFGQWCFSKGCGLVPLQRTQGMTHEVRKFNSAYESVKSYMHNLNTHRAFSAVREARYLARQKADKITGLSLVHGLERYSERRQEYVKEIRSMIRYNKLVRFD